MIELEGIGDYWELIGLALLAGGLGGLVGALLPGTTIPGGKSAIIGAGAAVAIMVVLPPTEETISIVDDAPVVTTQFSLIQLLATALIAGSAGPRVFQALQARTLVALAEERTDTVAQLADAELDQIKERARLDTRQGIARGAGPAVRRAAELDPTQARDQAAGLLDDVAAQGAEAVEASFTDRVSAAQNVIASVASRGRGESSGM